MCRFAAYLGRPLLISDVLLKPRNSLIQQSMHAREQGKDALNGDGFGLGWYAHDIDQIPGVFKSVQPAWSNSNLKNLANKIKTDCFFGHVRAASKGGVSQENCHPFRYEDLMLMHNGDIGDFILIKRKLRRMLNDKIYEWLKGETDSEHLFALFLHLLMESGKPYNPATAAEILCATIKILTDMRNEAGAKSPMYLNLALTNGHSIIACRYISDEKQTAETLYYSFGKKFEHIDGKFHMLPAENNRNEAVLIVSEKLTGFKSDWHEIPQNNLLIVDGSFNIYVNPVEI